MSNLLDCLDITLSPYHDRHGGIPNDIILGSVIQIGFSKTENNEVQPLILDRHDTEEYLIPFLYKLKQNEIDKRESNKVQTKIDKYNMLPWYKKIFKFYIK